ncbi:Uncharacterised protein [Mycobacteroides abscessus]|nr:Uncharacterised protein [Mycobacteroides abscessus]
MRASERISSSSISLVRRVSPPACSTTSSTVMEMGNTALSAVHSPSRSQLSGLPSVVAPSTYAVTTSVRKCCTCSCRSSPSSTRRRSS